MNGGLGGIGKQVSNDLFELGKSVASGMAKATTDTITDTIEQVLKAPTGVLVEGGGKPNKQNEEQEKQKKEFEKKQKEKRQFQEIKGQLEEYIQKKKHQEAQIAQERAQEENEKKQKDSYEKQKKESFLKQLMKRLAGQAHGETDRQKE